MSELPSLLSAETDEGLRLARETRRLLAPRPTQLFCEPPGGKTLVLEIGMEMTVGDLMHLVEQRTGIPASQQRLMYGHRTLADRVAKLSSYDGIFGTQVPATVRVLGRLLGGVGVPDRAAMEHVHKLHMRRGNVGPDVLETEGRSFALKNFGRELGNPMNPARTAFRRKVAEILGFDDSQIMDWVEWRRVHWPQVYAVVLELTQAGNCGDFANVTAAKWMEEATEEEYVYEVQLFGDCPTCTKKRDKHHFDHQFCVTYPASDGSRERSEDQMRQLTIPQMDPAVASVVDAWHEHRVIPLAQFMGGENCYDHAVGADNLRIVAVHRGGVPRLQPKQVKKLRAAISEEVEAYTDTLDFDCQRLLSVVDAGWDPDSALSFDYQAELTVEAHFHLDGKPLSWLDCKQTLIEPRFAEVMAPLLSVWGRWYEEYAAAGTDEEQKQHLRRLEEALRQGAWPRPAVLAFLKATVAQEGVEQSVQALLQVNGAMDWFRKGMQNLQTFDMDEMGEVQDLRDADQLLVQLDAVAPRGPAPDPSSWRLFVRDALALSDAELLRYSQADETHRNRCMHPQKVREKLFRHVSGLGGTAYTGALDHLGPDFMGQYFLWLSSKPSAVGRALDELDAVRRLKVLRGCAALWDLVLGSKKLRPRLFEWEVHQDGPLLASILERVGRRLSADQLLLAVEQHPEIVLGEAASRDALFRSLDTSKKRLRTVYADRLSPAQRGLYRGKEGSLRDRRVAKSSDLAELPFDRA